MRYLALMGLMMSTAALPGCTEKGNDTEGATETSGTTDSTATSGVTDPESSTGSSGESSTTGEPTTGETGSTGDTGSTTDTSTGSTTAPLDEDCAFLIGKNFVSKQQFPCGPPMDPNDPGELCADEVAFTAETFNYQSSDYGVSGDYTCAAGKITAVDDIDAMYSGEIDAGTGVLVWENLEFLPE